MSNFQFEISEPMSGLRRLCRVCGNSALTLPPWVGATARRQRGYWVGRVGGCFAVVTSKTGAGGGGTKGSLPAAQGYTEGRMTKSK